MYLDYFRFKTFPFSLTPNVEFFCQLKGHQEALNTVLFSLKSGEGFIKIIGEVGSGKTLLCRKVQESLDENFIVIHLPNPDLHPIELRKAIASELNIPLDSNVDPHTLHQQIEKKLLALKATAKNIVLLIDEAQALPVESLETIRLLTNLETNDVKLLQVVLIGQRELNDKLNQPNLRQLKQRIAFSYHLPLLTREELETYLFHRLSVAGYTLSPLFSRKVKKRLYRASRGIPRIVNILCHKALLAAYGRGEVNVSLKAMQMAVQDTEIAIHSHKILLLKILLSLSALVGVVLLIYLRQGII